MTLSYDYSELLKEIHEELEDGMVSLNTYIQVLRSKKPVYQDYRPVIDWYYDDMVQMQDFETDIFDSEKTKKKLIKEREEYLATKSQLESIKVGELIFEMEYHNQIIK